MKSSWQERVRRSRQFLQSEFYALWGAVWMNVKHRRLREDSRLINEAIDRAILRMEDRLKREGYLKKGE